MDRVFMMSSLLGQSPCQRVSFHFKGETAQEFQRKVRIGGELS